MAIELEQVFETPRTLIDVTTQWCPGCSYGIAQREVAEVVEELGLREQAVCVVGVGCHTNAIVNFDFDVHSALHGRAPAVATGIKRARPDLLVFTIQGDGDLAAEGLAEIMHSAVRRERFTTLFWNNAIYGQTGGQMAPTTLPGQKTSTSPEGRNPDGEGSPLQMAEIIAMQPGAAYVVRTSMHNPSWMTRSKKAIRTAFQVQQAGLGFSFVEILTNCPTNWRMTAVESLDYMEEAMLPHFPLGDIKVPEGYPRLSSRPVGG